MSAVNEAGPHEYDFFISWKHATTLEYATDLADELRSLGYTSFFSPWCMDESTQGEDARRELEDALASCASMIAIIDAAAASSEWVLWEIRLFLLVRSERGKLFLIYFDGIGPHEESGDPARDEMLAELSEIAARYEQSASAGLLDQLRQVPDVRLLHEFGHPVFGGPISSRRIAQEIATDHGRRAKSGESRGHENIYEEGHFTRVPQPRCGCLIIVALTLVMIGIVIGIIAARWIFL